MLESFRDCHLFLQYFGQESSSSNHLPQNDVLHNTPMPSMRSSHAHHPPPSQSTPLPTQAQGSESASPSGEPQNFS